MKKKNEKRKLQRQQEKKVSSDNLNSNSQPKIPKERGFYTSTDENTQNVLWKVVPPLQRTSHQLYFETRNWNIVSLFWKNCMSTTTEIPNFIKGDELYGLTNLQSIGELGV